MELDLERSICDALALAEKVDDLIEDGVKIHLALYGTWGGDSCPLVGHRIRPHPGGHVLYVPQRARKGKQEVRYGASGAHRADAVPCSSRFPLASLSLRPLPPWRG